MKPSLEHPLATIPHDPRKFWSYMGMLALLLLLGLVLVAQNGLEGQWGAVFMLIVIPGLAMFMIGGELRLKGPIVIIAEDGLLDRRKGPEGVAWEDIQEASTKRRVLNRGIRIAPTNGERHDRDCSPRTARPQASTKRRVLNRGIRIELTNGERYDIDCSLLKARPQDIMKLIQEAAQRALSDERADRSEAAPRPS